MQKYKEITYSDWLNLVKDVKTYGMDEEKYENLLRCYPYNLSREWEGMLFKQVSELEEELLRVIFNRLEKGLNNALHEADAELADKVLRDHIKRLKHCSFFLSYQCISQVHRDSLYQNICENVKYYQQELVQFIKNIGLDYQTQFVDDILYLLQKRNPYRFVCEWKTSKV
jgi:hypothetical protein